MKYKYKVNGLDCANCTQKLEDSLNKKEEINDCVISFATGMMTFESEYDIDAVSYTHLTLPTILRV